MRTIADLVGKNIRMRRVAMGLSQTALAKSAKVSNITLNRIENGKQAPQGASLTMIAEALGCSEAELYGSPKDEHETPPDILNAIREGAAIVAREGAAVSFSPDVMDLIAKLSPRQIANLEDVIRGAVAPWLQTDDRPSVDEERNQVEQNKPKSGRRA